MIGTMFQTEADLNEFASGLQAWSQSIREQAAAWKPRPGDAMPGDRVRHLITGVEGTVTHHSYTGFYVCEDEAGVRADWMHGGLLVRCDGPGNWERISTAIVVLPVRSKTVGPFTMVAFNEPTVTIIPGHETTTISFMGMMTATFPSYLAAYLAAKHLAERGELPSV